MLEVHNILDCCFLFINKLRKSPRFILSLVMGVLICVFMTNHIINLAYKFQTDIQVFEPFIWCFSDRESILFTSFALILPMSAMPSLDNSDINIIFRKGKFSWLIGTIITIILVAFFYMLILLFFTGIMTVFHISFANKWSDTAITMSLNPYVFERTLTVVRSIIKVSTPFESVIQIFLLNTFYMLLLMSINLFVSLKYNKKVAVTVVFAVSFISFLVNPAYFSLWFNIDEKIMHVANLLSVWFSPLNHAVFSMHTNGYDDLPTINESLLLYAIIIIFLFFISYKTVKKQDILFKGECDG